MTSLFGLGRARLVAAEEEAKLLLFQSRRDSCCHRGTSLRGLFLPDRSAGLPARCCCKHRRHLEAYRTRDCFLPRCPARAPADTTAPSRADRYRCRAIVIGREHRPCGCAREGHDGRLRDHGSSRFDNDFQRSVHGPAGIRRQDGRHRHQHSSEPRQIASPGPGGNRPDVVSAPRTLPRPAEAMPAYAVTRTAPAAHLAECNDRRLTTVRLDNWTQQLATRKTLAAIEVLRP